MKDSEIRKFIHDNMPQIEDNGRFMAELVRQIELLPTPASLSGKSEEEKQANIKMIMDIARSIKRRNRANAVVFSILAVVILTVAVAAMFLVPELNAVASKYYVYIAVAFAAVVVAVSMSLISISRL